MTCRIRWEPGVVPVVYVVKTYRTEGASELRECLAHLGGPSSNLLLIV